MLLRRLPKMGEAALPPLLLLSAAVLFLGKTLTPRWPCAKPYFPLGKPPPRQVPPLLFLDRFKIPGPLADE